MPRSYAQIFCAIWDEDSDFRALDARAQRTFFLLLTQSEITACGVLPLRAVRWARMAADTTVADVRTDLAILHVARYIVVDEDTEEVLVRSFVRHDGGHRNGKRRPLILRTAREVTSQAIRWAIAEEFARLMLPLEGLPQAPPDALSDGLSDAVSPPPEPSTDRPTLRDREDTGDTPIMDTTGLFYLVDSPSDTPCDDTSDGTSPSRGVVVTKALLLDTHNPTTREPLPNPPSSGSDATDTIDAEIIDEAPGGAPMNKPVTAQTILAAFIDALGAEGIALPKRHRGHFAREIKNLLDEDTSPDLVWRALMSQARAGDLEHPSWLGKHVVNVQQGPKRWPRRMTAAEEAVTDLTENGSNDEVVAALASFLDTTPTPKAVTP